MLHIKCLQVSTFAPVPPLWRHSLADRGAARWQFQANKFQQVLPAGMGMICPNDIKWPGSQVHRSCWMMAMFFYTQRKYIHRFIQRGTFFATRWDLQDRDAVSDDEKRWVTGAYSGRMVDGFLLARFEVPSFLEVNVKSIEIADMMCNYMIFRFKLQYIH